MPRISTDRSHRTPSVDAGGVIHLDGYGALPDMTVLEFCAGMALARHGPLTARGIAAEISVWLGRPIRASALRQQLGTLVRRGWAQVGKAGTYSLVDAGIEALRSFYSALVRMLDGGRRLLDVAVFMSLIKEFERSGA